MKADEEGKRQPVVLARLTPKEHRVVRQIARVQRVSQSAFVRDAIRWRLRELADGEGSGM